MFLLHVSVYLFTIFRENVRVPDSKKNTCFYAAIICGTVAASCNIKDKTLLVYNNFFMGYNHMCCITMLYVTTLRKSVIKIFCL